MDIDDEEFAFALPSVASATLTLSPSHQTMRPSPLGAIPRQEAYILQLASLTNIYAVSCSAPSSDIPLFDKSTLKDVGAFKGHEGGITKLCVTGGAGGGKVLMSSGMDGVVRGWDERVGEECIARCKCPVLHSISFWP